MRDADAAGALRPVEGAWGRATLVVQLALFATPAIDAWTSTIDITILLPVLGLTVALVAAVVMLASPTWRPVGIRVRVATLVAAVVEVGLVWVLIAAFSQTSPGWDLS